MQRLRAGVLVGVGGAAGALALALATTTCADATEILVEVTSDACPRPGRTGKSINSTGIAVGTAATIDDARPTAVRYACEPDSDRVGTLTLYPSGDSDSEVTFKVVSGVDRPLDQCGARDGYAGCIAQHRTMRFVPRTTQRVAVRISLLCLGVTCPEGKTCQDGVCVARDAPRTEDGAVPDGTPVTEGGKVDSATDAPGDGATGPRGCDPAKCTGAGVIGCVAGVCVVDCGPDGGVSRCSTGANVCPNDQDCRVVCGDGACANVSCTTQGTCTVECDGVASCGAVKCDSARCDVRCTGSSSCVLVNLAGAEARVTCPGIGGGGKVCDDVRCRAARCALECNGNGCSGAHYCCSPTAPTGCTSTGVGWDIQSSTACP